MKKFHFRRHFPKKSSRADLHRGQSELTRLAVFTRLERMVLSPAALMVGRDFASEALRGNVGTVDVEHQLTWLAATVARAFEARVRNKPEIAAALRQAVGDCMTAGAWYRYLPPAHFGELERLAYRYVDSAAALVPLIMEEDTPVDTAA